MDTTRLLALLAVLSLVAPAGLAAAESQPDRPCAGTMEDPANGTTVVSVQGAHNGSKTTARQIGFGPNGSVVWMNPAGNSGVVWSYDVDPMRNGHLFVTATTRENGEGKSVFYELDPATNERVWSVTLDMLDTHDADLIDGGEQILIANMRNYDEESGENNDRLAIYDREQGEIVWEWRFAEHYPKSVGGNYEEDWTHVNDVDRIGPGRYLASPRNLDQAIVVNRSTGEIDLKLGEDGTKSILNKQHNPDYLETDDGAPTMLVGDSENDRVVEYTKRNGSWDRTWALGNASTLHWPRDADRLPNGNTLVTDSRNHRVFEVTPDGEIVWEVYTPWLPYDAERVRYGDGSSGPTIADRNASGDPALSGSAGGHEDPTTMERCAQTVASFDGGDGFTMTVDPTTTSVESTDGPTSDGGATDGGADGDGGVDTGDAVDSGDGSNGGDGDGSTATTGPGFGPVGALVALVALAVAGPVARRRD